MSKDVRVQVWVNGDTPLGEGRLVGKVKLVEAYKDMYKEQDEAKLAEAYVTNTVRFFSHSGLLPKVVPSELTKTIKRQQLMSFHNHYTPKIIMDDGSVVYGCQIWWKEIE